MTEPALIDGGGIYTLGRQDGSVMTDNYVDGVHNEYGGIYLDEGSVGFDITNNVITNCVRNWLFKGDYNQKTVYSDKPEKLAQDFETMGAKLLHVVDLDGAKDGKCINLETIKKIKQNTSMQIELGGGIRNLETVALYLDEVGIDRVILGTAAINDPEFLKNALCTYGAERIVVGVDVKDGYVSTSGWLETSAVPYLVKI